MKKIMSPYTVLFSLFFFFCADTQATGEEEDEGFVVVKKPPAHEGMAAQASPASDTQIIDGEKESKYDLRIEIPALEAEEGVPQEGQGASVFSKLFAFYNPRGNVPPKVQGVQLAGLLELIHFPLDALRLAAYQDLALKANLAQIALQTMAIYKLVEAGEPQAALYFVPHLALDLAYPLAEYYGVDGTTLLIAGGVGAALTVPLCLYSLWSLAEKYSFHPNTD